MTPRPPSSTLFPYTTLFRSAVAPSIFQDGFGTRWLAVDAETGDPVEILAFAPAFAESPDFAAAVGERVRSEEHTSELQSHVNLVCRLLLEKKKKHKFITMRS